MKNNLNCFVACSFTQSDAEKYFKVVSQILKTNFSFKAIRVDRINHNQNIDKKLIELINNCAFCIADLTYARPSVYFEAGYAEGIGKMVIYTSREDHFRHQVNDEHGNFRIHFDVSTKNIIRWNNLGEEFKIKLKNRIKLISKPILDKINVDSAKLHLTSKFTKRSLAQKKYIITNICQNIFLTNKYEIKPIGSNILAGYQTIKNKKSVIVFVTYNDIKITVNRISQVESLFDFHRGIYDIPFTETKDVTIVFNSINSVTTTQIQKALQDAVLVKDHTYHCKNASLAKPINYIFLDSIKSEVDVAEKVMKFTSLSLIPSKLFSNGFKELVKNQKSLVNPNRYGLL